MTLGHSKLATTSAIALALCPWTAQAENWADKLSVSGFASAVYHQTDESAVFNDTYDNQGSYDGTKMGLNFNANVNEQFNFASQFFATKEEDNYVVHLDWAFGEFKLTDSLSLRAGKLKFPVGLINEVSDVGYTYPWLHAPSSFYSEVGPNLNGPQITREAFTGGSLLWEVEAGDWVVEFDLFRGDINLEGMTTRKLTGLVINANWNDEIQLELSTYEGTMRDISLEGAVAPPSGSAWDNTLFAMQSRMEGGKHSADSFGIKYDNSQFLFMSEISKVEMANITAMEATGWYSTLGYQVGAFLPTITYENYEQGDGSGAFDDDQDTITLGLRWDYLSNVAIKFEIAQIKQNNANGNGGFFGYENNPKDDTTNMFGIGIDTVF
tara:strand:- start:53633 stop:54775 length:1143 start_codon:yes stop_codon:yes gene_type:complete